MLNINMMLLVYSSHCDELTDGNVHGFGATNSGIDGILGFLELLWDSGHF